MTKLPKSLETDPRRYYRGVDRMLTEEQDVGNRNQKKKKVGD
jgi:hypothetical protein